jgi:transposase
MRFDLSDEEWALLEPLLPKSRKSGRVDDRKIVNAIFYVLRTGMPWRDLPARYGRHPLGQACGKPFQTLKSCEISDHLFAGGLLFQQSL